MMKLGDARSNIAAEAVRRTEAKITITAPTGAEIVAAADLELATQYRTLAVDQLRRAASSLAIAADHVPDVYESDERKLWRAVDAMAHVVEHGAINSGMLRRRVDDLLEGLV